MAKIHPTAIVEDGARLDESVEVGPFCIIGPHAHLKSGVRLVSHVIIANETIIGENSVVHPFASLGATGQIYQNVTQPGQLLIGARCEIREHVTMNCGSPKENNVTEIGDDCMFMVGAHVAHDCTVGRKCIFANGATLGGHVKIGEQVFIGGLSAVHQFCTIGEHAIIGGVAGVKGHVIPFASATGADCHLIGLNIIGLERRGFSDASIKMLNRAYRAIFHGKDVFAKRLAETEEKYGDDVNVRRMIDFIKTVGKRRPLAQPRLHR